MQRFINATRRWIVEVLAVTFGIIDIGFGLSIILVPQGLSGLATFETLSEWMAPQMWGSVLLAGGVLMAAAAFIAPRSIVAAAVPLTITWAVFLSSVVLSFNVDRPVPTAVWMYLSITLIHAIISISSLAERR